MLLSRIKTIYQDVAHQRISTALRGLQALIDELEPPQEVELTDTQARVLGFIRSFTLRHGYSPTVREIGAELDFSSSAAHYQIKILANLGYLQYTPPYLAQRAGA